MLPDLWRMADRRVRPSSATEDPGEGAVAAELLEPVLAGIGHHVAADRWFHAAPVFLEGERRLAGSLRAAAVEVPRLGLFAHVLWEMCLDGALVRREGFGPVLDELRAGLSAIDGAPSETAASMHHFLRVARTGPERAAFEVRLRRLRDEVARGPWIEGYQDGVGLALRLSGVRSRFGFAPFTAEQTARLAALLEDLAGDADRAVGEVLDGWERAR